MLYSDLTIHNTKQTFSHDKFSGQLKDVGTPPNYVYGIHNKKNAQNTSQVNTKRDSNAEAQITSYWPECYDHASYCIACKYFNKKANGELKPPPSFVIDGISFLYATRGPLTLLK